jgi:hypothetical protein
MSEKDQKKSGQDKLDALIEKKTNETEALKELLKKLTGDLPDQKSSTEKQ